MIWGCVALTNIQAFLLGLVQGLAEFLPISSSGHTTLLQMFFGLEEAPEILNVLLHMGTLLVVLIVYRRRVWNMIRHPFRSELKWLILATLPTVAAALTIKDKLEATFGDVKYLGYLFVFTSFVMLVGEAVNRLRDKKHKPVRWYDALVMGCMQVLAILPGVSRSGSTISGGMITGLSRKRAVDFSFLMAIPAILGSAVLEGKHIYDMAEAEGVELTAKLGELVQGMGGAVPLVIGVATAAVSGFLAIRLMLRIVRHIGLRWFAAYTFLLGAFLIARQVLSV